MIDKIKKIKSRANESKALISRFHLEMERCAGGFSLQVGGVLRIAEYTPTAVRLMCDKFSLSVMGEALSVSLYENKTVEISGKITGVGLKDGKA